MAKVTHEFDLYGKHYTLETGELAKQTTGAVLVKQGDTTVLMTAVVSKERKNYDFFPLTVDFVERMYVVSTHDPILFFTNRGRVYQLGCHEITEASRTARGTAVVNLLQLDGGEKATVMLPMPRERVEDFCRLGCLFTVNADEALFMTGTTRVEDAALRLHDMSGRDAVVTDGGRGAIVADNASVRRIPGFPVAIVDTIGSGDAHTGGVIAGLMCGLPIDECVLLANRVASVVTGREGGAGAPTSDALLTEHC